MIFEEEPSELMHYGTKRHSGRYPWGSGEDPEERSRSFQGMVKQLKKDGLSEKEIAKGLGLLDRHGEGDINALRAQNTITKNQIKSANRAHALRLQATNMSNVAIGKEMGINESSVRALLDDSVQDKLEQIGKTADMLKDKMAEGYYLDVGLGTAARLNISNEKLKKAVYILKQEGYKEHLIPVPQLGTGKNTLNKVLAPPGVSYSEVRDNQDKIHIFYSHLDANNDYQEAKPPKILSAARVGVRYADEGGAAMDGVIQLRRGVSDISLGSAKYAQVRIRVGKDHYLKGMAMYADDLPDGVDVMFNTNKSKGANKLDALKKLERDKEGNLDSTLPFGALIKVGGQRGVINIVNEEGDWGKWSKNLSSQFLSKQTTSLAQKQLDLKYKAKLDELDEITKLTNPAVRRALLEKFADDADSSAVHLKAAALPRQGTHAILPLNTIKEGEVYAPNYPNGTNVVLVRYPHGGKFEIPELVVNNKNKEALAVIGGARDAIGIHTKVAERLSGADFDGDTVLVIPNNDGRVKSAPALSGLKNFDAKVTYKPYDGMRTIDGGIYHAKTKSVTYDKKPDGNDKINKQNKQTKMGEVSNLITDMTIKGAPNNLIEKAVRHSMVVIDAEKHHLNFKQSYLDNDIAMLKTRYQGGANKGAATIISRASSDVRVYRKVPRVAALGGPIDPKTGAKVFMKEGDTYTDKQGKVHVFAPLSFPDGSGKVVFKKETSKKLAEYSNAFDLVSDHGGQPIEHIYANHSNKLKSLANNARKAAYETKSNPYSPSARKVYSSEVQTLDAKLNIAIRNKPLERKAQQLANAQLELKKLANPHLEKGDIKKIKATELTKARLRIGAKKIKIDILPNEWEAIQAGAITDNKLAQILNNTEPELIKQYATPRSTTGLSVAKLNHAKALLSSGYTQAEVAQAIGVPVSTLMYSVDDKGVK